jgi:cytochrome c556
MKRVLWIAGLCVAVAVGVSAQAPAKIASEADYAATMKEVGSLNGGMAKAIKGGTLDAAAKAAPARLEALFKNVHAYWSDKKVADATAAADAALKAIAGLQKAMASNDMAAAETSRAALAAQCMACHTAHREKTPEGGWRMK